MTQLPAAPINHTHRIVWTRNHITGLLLLLLLSLTINSIPLDWGRSGMVPWSPDSIEGITIVRENRNLFGQWTYKYPRGHFLLNAICYKPFISYWEANPIPVRLRDGRIGEQVLDLSRLDRLATITRLMIILMSTATVWIVFLTTFLLFGDYLAAWLAGLMLAVIPLYVYFSHVGNVDVPYIFWLTWALYWAVKAIYINKWHHYLLLGFCSAYMICTKEGSAGYIVGLGLAIWLAMVGKALKEGLNLNKAIRSIISLKILLAIVVAVITFALLNGFIAGPGELQNRMSSWGNVTDSFLENYHGQWWLLKRACWFFSFTLGWPFLILVIISIIYGCFRFPFKVGLCLIPMLVFYAVIMVKVHFVAPRFFLGGFPGLAILVGITTAIWLRWRKIPLLIRAFPIATVYLLSLAYCIALDLEMANDTRNQTEAWFEQHVDKKSQIGIGIYNTNNTPRLRYNGYQVLCPWTFVKFPHANPDFLVISPSWYRKEDPTLKKKLLNGQMDYEQVAIFQRNFLRNEKGPLILNDWAGRTTRWISPKIIIFQKKKCP